MPNSMNESRVTIIDRENDYMPTQRVESELGGSMVIGADEASHSYVRLLADRVSNLVNSVPFKTSVGEANMFKFHRSGDAVPAIMVPSLATRSVKVNMNDPYTNNKMPTKLTALQGSTIVSKPADDAVMFSLAVERFDGETDGTITELTLQQEVRSVVDQIDREVTKMLFKTITEGDATGTKYYTKKNIPLAVAQSYTVRAEAIEDAIYAGVEMAKQLGSGLDDFAIAMSTLCYNDMERAARRAGFKAEDGMNNVSAYLGTEVFVYDETVTGEERSFFIMPKRHVAVSFREREDGTVFDCMVTRKGNTQSTVMEIVGVADLLINGFVKAKNDKTNQYTEVKLPLITKFVIGKAIDGNIPAN